MFSTIKRLPSSPLVYLVASLATLILCESTWACHACGVACDAGWQWVEVEEEYTACEPYTEEVERTVTISVPQVQKVPYQYTVMATHTEVRKGTRVVQKVIPETKTVTIKRDFGHWETQTVEVPACEPVSCHQGCGTVCSCLCPAPPACEKVWVPDVRSREVQITTYRTVSEEVPYEATILVCRPEVRTEQVDFVTYKGEQRKQMYPVTRYREVTKTRKVCVRQRICPCGEVLECAE